VIKYLLKPFYKINYHLLHGKLYKLMINNIDFFKPIVETKKNQTPIQIKQWLRFKVLSNKVTGAYWPIHRTSTFRGDWKNVLVGIDSSPTVSPGCYVQAKGEIYIGDYAQIAPNVGIISSNHFMLDIRKHIKGKVVIGDYCRIGMGSIIHPNVVLGDFVTVSSGSVVKDSFEQGYCVIGGNPAVIIEDYSENEKLKSKFVRYRNQYEYNGFIPSDQFEDFRKKNLNI